MDFGDRLKQIRTSQGLSQEQLAEKIGVSRQAITKWETKKGLPDIENMVILAEIFKVTLDELVLQGTQQKEPQPSLYESETVYDIDESKHFDIRMGSARSLLITSGSDEKVHICLRSDSLANLGSLYKIKLDEKRNKLDISCVAKKGISRYEAEAAVDVCLTLPAEYANHCEIDASTRELRIEHLRLRRLEYDGDAQQVFIRDVTGSVELTGKTDYRISLEGSCPKLDVNQFCANAVVQLSDPGAYRVVNNGRKCTVVYRRDDSVSDEPLCMDGEGLICVSGIRSEMVIDCTK
ncbi:MAG: helix-turn-helix transcriptional regulator [Clostridiales bacterium]|nr:helix-turn-helix transcriptional regulator [Clostridiales bacterium]